MPRPTLKYTVTSAITGVLVLVGAQALFTDTSVGVLMGLGIVIIVSAFVLHLALHALSKRSERSRRRRD